MKWLTIGIADVSAEAWSSDIPQWDDTTDFKSAFSFVVADVSSGAGPVSSLFNDVFATHRENIERKATNFVAQMTKSAGMTRLQLADNEPFKLDAATFPRWCADGSGEIAHQPFLLAISAMTLAWDANFYPCPGHGASLVALRGSLFVRLLHMATVRSWSNRDLASLLAFLCQTEFQTNWASDAKDIILKLKEAIWFLYGFLPLFTALPCEGEKSVQKAAVSSAPASGTLQQQQKRASSAPTSGRPATATSASTTTGVTRTVTTLRIASNHNRNSSSYTVLAVRQGDVESADW